MLKRLLSMILALALVLQGTVLLTGKNADAADGDPTVNVIGATLRFGALDVDGRQAIRVAIEVGNADKAKSCSIRFKIGSKTYTVSTDATLATSGNHNPYLYSKDPDANKIVYAAVINNIDFSYFGTNIEITGSAAGIDGRTYESDTVIKSVGKILDSIRRAYPLLDITMIDGTLYKNGGSSLLLPEDITNGSGVDPYDVDLFTVSITDKKVETVDGNTAKVDMRFFDGSAAGPYFTGNILNGDKSCDVVKKYKADGKEVHQARFFLDGKDKNNNNCRIFIEDNSIEVNDDMVISKPIFITNSSSLAFLETADVRGYMSYDPTDPTGKTRVIRYRLNSSNATPVPFREVKIPDNTHNYTKEVFTINIDVGGNDSVNGANGGATMIYFGGRSNCSNFNGNIIASDADTRLQYTNTIQTLSARYMLSGTGPDGKPMKMYIENNGIDNNGMVTQPTIITDNPSFAYVETAWTHGTVSWETGLTIHLWTTP